MQRRGILVKEAIPTWIRPRLPQLAKGVPKAIDDLAVTGRNAVGNASGVPWARVYSKNRSPRATEGWYVVFLFSAQGHWVYLSLNQGATKWRPGTYGSGSFVPQPDAEVRARATWARNVLAPTLSARGDRWPADRSPVDEVERHRVYHYPTTGGNYPKIVPNYMGFRYDGKLQSIHHVDDYENPLVTSPDT